MHAFLLVGHTNDNFDSEVKNLSKKISAEIMNFPLQKIDDVRSLNNLIRLSFNTPTLIVSKNIQDAGEEALNAFLKNLEEPQKNIFFALTAPSIGHVLPTIVSRCQIIRVDSQKQYVEDSGVNDFLNSNTSERLMIVNKIKDRAEAIQFTENLIRNLHNQKDFRFMEILIEILASLKKNGNVSLHLTSLVVRMESTHD